MKIQEVEGIVLGETNYSESSKILNVLTKEYGLIGIMSKGSRNMKSKLRGVSRKLVYGTFHIYYKENGLSTLIGVDVKNSFNEILKNKYTFDKREKRPPKDPINALISFGNSVMYTNVLKDAEEFSSPVILFHNTGDRDNTVLVIEDIIKALKNKGYKFGSLSQKIKPVKFLILISRKG